MSTTQTPLRYLWTARFKDGRIIQQPEDDTYSRHDPEAEYNPSAFRDVIEHMENSNLEAFALSDTNSSIKYQYSVNIDTGEFFVYGSQLSLEDTPLTERKVIFFRQVRQDYIDGAAQAPYVARYCFGYEGKNAQGDVEKKVIYING